MTTQGAGVSDKKADFFTKIFAYITGRYIVYDTQAGFMDATFLEDRRYRQQGELI